MPELDFKHVIVIVAALVTICICFFEMTQCEEADEKMISITHPSK
jgi:hypothetical protein